MKRIRRFLVEGKWRDKLSIQLGLLILTTNLLLLSVCFFVLYQVIEKVLQKNYEEANIVRFEQANYNIGNFCEQIELASTRLVSENVLKTLSKNSSISASKRTMYLQNCINMFEKEMNNYSYISAIVYFGKDGTILKCNKKGSLQTNYFYEKQDIEDGYYSSGIFDFMSEQNQKMNWFGGYTMEDLGFTSIQEGMNEEYYIVAARNISGNAAQLVFMIPMEYFTDIFCSVNLAFMGETYMVDGESRIVATRFPERLGEKREFTKSEKIYDELQSFEEDCEQDRLQILEYPVPLMGWRLVNETPIEEVTKEKVYLRNVLFIFCLLSVVVSFGFSMRWIVRLTHPLQKLTDAVRKVGEGELGYTLKHLPRNEIGLLTESFNEMSVELEEIFCKIAQVETEKREFEMESLRAQINPHFIYNTLNAIKWTAIMNDEIGIAESIAMLSELLEVVFKSNGALCTIREELDHVKKYVDIMNLRKINGYTLEIDVPEELMECQIIRFLLQPIVENAILHGFCDREIGRIRISMWSDGWDGFLQVADDGCGIEESKLKKLATECDAEAYTSRPEGVGLANVCRRIRNQYGEEYGITMENGRNGGAIITLKVRLLDNNNSLRLET